MAIDSWQAWYADGSRYYSDKTDWEDLPPVGIIYLVVRYTDGSFRRFSDGEYYYMLNGTAMSDKGPQSLIESLKWVKQGRWTTDEIMKRAEDEAMNLISGGRAGGCGCG